MTQPLRPERVTQNRVVRRFTAPPSAGGLGYRALGDWHQRQNNRGVETALLRDNLAARGYSPAQIGAALQRLESAADSTGITLYQANLRTYQLLRYGVPVQTAAGRPAVARGRASTALIRPLETLVDAQRPGQRRGLAALHGFAFAGGEGLGLPLR
jgi:hypothetical protein